MKPRRFLLSLPLFLLPLVLCCATPQAPQAPQAAALEVITLEDVVAMSHQGLPETEIIQRLDASRQVFVLSSADVRLLQQGGVSDRVIDHMMGTCLTARCWGPLRVRDCLWYRYGQFYATPPFAAYSGAYRFGD
jgi:hypothetical protein